MRARSRADQHGKARRMPKSTRLSPKGPSSTTVDQNCVAGAARDWRRNPRGPHAVFFLKKRSPPAVYARSAGMGSGPLHYKALRLCPGQLNALIENFAQAQAVLHLSSLRSKLLVILSFLN